MNQYLFCVFAFGFSFLLSGQPLTGNKIIREGRLAEIILENEVLRIRIHERGGRLSSLYDKKRQQELCDSDDLTFSGLAKIRDILFNNIETVTGRYTLELIDTRSGQLEVRASFPARTGNLAGMQITRTYVLAADAAFVGGKVFVKCLDKESSFQLNLHNLFPLQSLSVGDLNYYIPTKRGLAVFDHASAELQKLNLVLDPAFPWCAFLDRKAGFGLALQPGNLEQLEGLYVWGQNNSFTLEANYKDVQLKPMAAADEWETSFRLLPLRGLNNLWQVNNYGAFAAETTSDELHIKFMSAVSLNGTISIWQNNEKLAESGRQQLPAGEVMTVSSKRTDYQKNYTIKLQTENFETSLQWSETPGNQQPVTLEKQLPKKEVSGVNGFYFYFPELWLSPETPTELSFGLRGDFRKMAEFRFAIDLPAGVELQHSRAEVLKESTTTIHDVQYNRKEIHSFRKVDYFSAMRLNLQLGADFQDGSKVYVQALWKGGSQSPQEIIVRQAPPLPEIGSGLRFFKIGVENDAEKEAWPDYRRIGINSIMVSNWGPPLILYDYKGKGYFENKINDLKAAGLFPIFGAGAPFCNIDRVMRQLNPYYTGAGTLYHPEKNYQAIDLAQARAVDINGNQMLYPCPSFLGPLLDKAVDSLKSLIDYGFDHVCYDEEMWGNGNTLCFCQNCKNKFAAFLKDRYPELQYIDPAVATMQPKQHPEIDDAWWDFKTDQVATIYKTLRHTLETYQPKPEVQRQMWIWVDCSVNEAGRYGAITSRLTDYAKLGHYANLLLPMIYTPMAQEVERITATGEKLLAGVPGQIAAGLSPNRTYEYYRVASNNLAPMDAIRQQLLETFFAGGQAAVIWAYRSALRGAYDYYKIAQAVQMLMPVEDILFRGQRAVTISSSNPEVKVSAYEYQGQMAVLARNYQADTSKTILTFPEKYTQATNTLTRQTREFNATLEIILAEERVLVFLLQ